MPESFKSVLLVDDDITLREMYAERLKAEGFVIDMAKDGEEAYQKAVENHPNIILLDIMMPKVNGLDVLKRLKENPETKDIPVIVLTALIQDREKMESITKGADDYIVKSEMMPGEIIQKVKGILEGVNNHTEEDQSQTQSSQDEEQPSQGAQTSQPQNNAFE